MQEDQDRTEEARNLGELAANALKRDCPPGKPFVHIVLDSVPFKTGGQELRAFLSGINSNVVIVQNGGEFDAAMRQSRSIALTCAVTSDMQIMILAAHGFVTRTRLSAPPALYRPDVFMLGKHNTVRNPWLNAFDKRVWTFYPPIPGIGNRTRGENVRPQPSVR